MRLQLIIAASLLLLALPAQAENMGVQQPAQPDALADQWANTAQEVLIRALSLTGIKYKYGGSTPVGTYTTSFASAGWSGTCVVT